MALSKVDLANQVENQLPQSLVADNVNFRNIVINGDMSIAQRGTSTTSISSGSNYYTVDRNKVFVNSGGTWTMTQETDAPSGQGFVKSLKMDCTTANASLSAGSYLFISQRFEGQMLQYLKKGTSSAESLTASFWVKSNKTGTYILEIKDADNTRTINKSYTISAADTWEKKTITFDGDTTGTLDNDNAQSIQFNFWLAAGSTYSSGTLQTSWGSETNANRAVGQVNLADSTSNEFYITGIQLEAGTSASDFEFLPVDVNLQRCQRYYFHHTSGTSKTVGLGAFYTTTSVDSVIYFPVTMRSTPSMDATSGTGYYTVYVAGAGRTINGSLSVNRVNTQSTQFYGEAQADTAGRAGLWTTTNSSASIAFNSEL